VPDGRRVVNTIGISRFRKSLQAAALALCILLIGCASPDSASPSPSFLPVTGSSSVFQVHEYALVEASTDNPNHKEFQERAVAVVAARRSPWSLFGSGDIFRAPNQVLAPYGYHLAANPEPPFSGIALYHDDQLVQRDIVRFWPVSIIDSQNGDDRGDFLLSFETISGEKWVADMDGIRPRPGQDQPASSTTKAIIGNQLAYADSVGSEIGLITSPDSQNDEKMPPDSFGRQIVAGQAFYFHQSGDLVHLNYAGQELHYTYDQVIHNYEGSNAIFNPGGTGRVSWFYALRDGLWYYIEAGAFD
jgi:hypothetical protein